MTLESRITELATWVKSLPHGGLTKVANAADLPVSTVQSLFIRNCRPKSVENLIRIENARAKIEREGDAA